MGHTFAAALVKKTGTAPVTRKALRESMEALGYVNAAKVENAPLRWPLYNDRKSAWLTISLEMPESLEGQMTLLRSLAAQMHTAILYFMNFDSDLLFLAATDGTAVQHVQVGFCDDVDLPPDSAQMSIFDALLPDDAARKEFRRILTADMMEHVFSESAALELAPLFGYTPEALFIDEDAPPFAELAFELADKEGVTFLMPEDAPPAFTKEMAMYAYANPTNIQLVSCGGAG